MIKRSFESIATTQLTRLLVLLPLTLTVTVLAQTLNLVNRFVDPGSIVSKLFATLNYPFSSNPFLAYVFGTLILIATIYLLELDAQSSLKRPLQRLTDRTLRRVPLVGNLYNIADRFVELLDQKQKANIGVISPVQCFFDDDSVAVLALAPSAQPIEIDKLSYLTVLIPTTPVPSKTTQPISPPKPAPAPRPPASPPRFP